MNKNRNLENFSGKINIFTLDSKVHILFECKILEYKV